MAGFLAPTLLIVSFLATYYAIQFKGDATLRCSTCYQAVWPKHSGIVRVSATRLRSAARSSLPAVATPSFANESPYDDDHLRESHPEVDDRSRRSVHHTSFL